MGKLTSVPPTPANQRLSSGQMENHKWIINSYHARIDDDEVMRDKMLYLLSRYNSNSTANLRERFREVSKLMQEKLKEKDAHWYMLPPSAYENELRFFDSDNGVRNVPLLKKNRKTQLKGVELFTCEGKP